MKLLQLKLIQAQEIYILHECLSFIYSFIARKVPTSLIHKGLILFLKFDGSLSSENSKWQLITKFNYISEAFCKKLPDNLQFDFKKEETFDEQIKI